MDHEWCPVMFASLPDWLRDNELIETGHRPQLRNFYSCLLSVFSVHSETGNIWTHLIGWQIIFFPEITSNQLCLWLPIDN